MSSIKITMDLVETIMKDAEHANVNPDLNMVLTPARIEEIKTFVTNSPWLNTPKRDTEKFISYQEVMPILLDSALQFCFWYGNANIRPNDSASGKITEIVNNAYSRPKSLETIAHEVKTAIRKERFTMIPERSKMIDDIIFSDVNISKCVTLIKNGDVHPIMDYLVESFDCFASDLFLKRASLAIGMMQMKFGTLTNMNELFLPADYQIPKAMRHYGYIILSESLERKIDSGTIIESGSKEETELRAASIKAAFEIQKLSGILPYHLDAFLFSKRKEIPFNHHLTITTDY